MSCTAPEANCPAPVVTCRMPSAPASAKPRIAPLTVSDEVTFTAASAWPRAAARARLAAYCWRGAFPRRGGGARRGGEVEHRGVLLGGGDGHGASVPPWRSRGEGGVPSSR